jgi:hypothetical protein
VLRNPTKLTARATPSGPTITSAVTRPGESISSTATPNLRIADRGSVTRIIEPLSFTSSGGADGSAKKSTVARAACVVPDVARGVRRDRGFAACLFGARGCFGVSCGTGRGSLTLAIGSGTGAIPSFLGIRQYNPAIVNKRQAANAPPNARRIRNFLLWASE